MYYCAQRVQSHDGTQGINAFLYLHGSYEWDGRPPLELAPERDPGVLADSTIEVPPPGNRVRSYLDIVAPDSTPMNNIARAALSHPPVAKLPVDWVCANVWCRFGADLALAPQWRHELQRLLARIILLSKQQELGQR